MKNPIKLVGLLGALAIVVSACGPAATAAPSKAPATQGPAVTTAPASEAPTQTGMSGELTLWHSYGSGGGETGALDQVLAAVEAQNPDLKITVVEQPFSDIFTKWQTDVLAGEKTPDLYIAPNECPRSVTRSPWPDCSRIASISSTIVSQPCSSAVIRASAGAPSGSPP